MTVNKQVFRDIAELNPFLQDLASWKPDENLVEENRQKVKEFYGREPVFALLKRAYQAALQIPVTHKITKPILLELYLDPARLFPAGISHE
jgi:hypothetical protein